jgi:hypothetical protein
MYQTEYVVGSPLHHGHAVLGVSRLPLRAPQWPCADDADSRRCVLSAQARQAVSQLSNGTLLYFIYESIGINMHRSLTVCWGIMVPVPS